MSAASSGSSGSRELVSFKDTLRPNGLWEFCEFTSSPVLGMNIV